MSGLHGTGAQAETLAAAYLERQGLKVLARNFHCRHGEIDLVARDADTLVFVEVRLRSNAQFGDAATSITRSKQAKLVAAGAYYLALHGAQDPCRFDAILLDRLDARRIVWLRDIIGT